MPQSCICRFYYQCRKYSTLCLERRRPVVFTWSTPTSFERRLIVFTNWWNFCFLFGLPPGCFALSKSVVDWPGLCVEESSLRLRSLCGLVFHWGTLASCIPLAHMEIWHHQKFWHISLQCIFSNSLTYFLCTCQDLNSRFSTVWVHYLFGAFSIGFDLLISFRIELWWSRQGQWYRVDSGPRGHWLSFVRQSNLWIFYIESRIIQFFLSKFGHQLYFIWILGRSQTSIGSPYLACNPWNGKVLSRSSSSRGIRL